MHQMEFVISRTAHIHTLFFLLPSNAYVIKGELALLELPQKVYSG